MRSSASAPRLEATARAFFDEEPQQARDLRQLFEWIAGSKGARQISRRQFKERLPEIRRRCPQLVSSFTRLDGRGEAVVRLEDFTDFCGRDARFVRETRKSSGLRVFGTDHTGQRAPKEATNPERACDLGTPPPLLPWEVSHTVEWTVEDLTVFYNRPCPYAIYGGAEVRAGSSIASPAFEAAGVRGHLRFWPAGYWTMAQAKTRERLAPHDCKHESAPPAFNSWCGIAACLPRGTHLSFRFFIGDAQSGKRDCFWMGGAHAETLWGPPDSRPPPQLRSDAGPGSITIGVEIFQNLASPPPPPADFARLVHPEHGLRNQRRPLLPGLSASRSAPTLAGAAAPPEPSRTLGRSLRAAATQAMGSTSHEGGGDATLGPGLVETLREAPVVEPPSDARERSSVSFYTGKRQPLAL